MLEVGLAKSVSTMNQLYFDREFRNFYGQALDFWPSVVEADHFSGDWLASMVRKHRKAYHPLYHILLQDFLAQREQHELPFGAGPWPCLNPLASHRSQPLIKTVTQHSNHGNKVGVFSCTCGYAYTRCFYLQTGEVGHPRFLRYGPLLAPALRQLVIDGAGLRAAGRFLGLDPKTVVRLASELSIAVLWKARPVDHVERMIRPKLPVQSVPALSCSAAEVASVCRMSGRNRRNWPEIDSAWASKLRALVDIVRAEIPPVRITVAELERRVNQRGWLLKRRRHLPQTMAFLDGIIETTKAFQFRRIDWAIVELQRSNAPVKAWQVMRKAGVRSTSLDGIKAVLDRAPGTLRMPA